jgi:Uma2 family endonuclease
MVVRQPQRFTVEDFLALPEDGRRYELIHGELIDVSEGASRAHQRFVALLGARLVLFAESKGVGEVYFAPFDVFLTIEDVYEPDILFVSRARLSLMRKDGVHGAPDLVVEVLSPSTGGRDRMVKLALYAKAGVPEYWIVDPEGRTLERLLLVSPGVYRTAERLDGAVDFAPESFPGLVIALGELWQLPEWFER